MSVDDLQERVRKLVRGLARRLGAASAAGAPAASQPSPLERYGELLARRLPTLRLALSRVRRRSPLTVVELGTSRSFVPGGVEGCLVNDPRYWSPDEPARWDWGSGLFTRVVAEEFAARRDFTLHSVDTSEDALSISRAICAPYLGSIQYHHLDSETFLRRFDGRIDLLYMDAGEADAGAEQLHLREARIVVERDLVPAGGVVLVDDVDMPEGFVSKGELSIPYLEDHGYEVLMSDYQVVLEKR